MTTTVRNGRLLYTLRTDERASSLAKTKSELGGINKAGQDFQVGIYDRKGELEMGRDKTTATTREPGLKEDVLQGRQAIKHQQTCATSHQAHAAPPMVGTKKADLPVNSADNTVVMEKMALRLRFPDSAVAQIMDSGRFPRTSRVILEFSSSDTYDIQLRADARKVSRE